MGSPVNAPKVKALAANPKVALTVDTDSFPPHVLLVRGEAAVEVVDPNLPAAGDRVTRVMESCRAMVQIGNRI
jgi:hypothetical protein